MLRVGDEDGMVNIIHTCTYTAHVHCTCVREYHVRYNTLGFREMAKREKGERAKDK